MKRLAAMIMALLLLAGCGGAAPEAAADPNLEELVETLSQQYDLTMPSPVDDQFLQEVFGIRPEDVLQYAGRLSMSAASADSILAVEPAEGKTEEVRSALEDRLAFVRESFRQFQPESYEKARAGVVCQEGNSLFLLILGREGNDPAQEVEAAMETLAGWMEDHQEAG